MVIENRCILRKMPLLLLVMFVLFFPGQFLPSDKDKSKGMSLQLEKLEAGKYVLLVGNKKAFTLQLHQKDLTKPPNARVYSTNLPGLIELGSCLELIIKPAHRWRIGDVKLVKVPNTGDDEINFGKKDISIIAKCALFGYRTDKGSLYLLLKSDCLGIKLVKYKDGLIFAEEKHDLLIDWNGKSEISLGDGTLCDFEDQGVPGGVN